MRHVRPPGGALRSARELRRLAGEVVTVDLRHPAWLSLVGGTALLEQLARLAPSPIEEDCYAAYLSANGGPRSDTFMARDHTPVADPAERIARAVLRARAAAAVLERLDGEFPAQPLHRALARRDGWLRRVPVEKTRFAAIVTANGTFLSDLAAPPGELARALGKAAAGAGVPGGPLARVEPSDPRPLPASVAVDLRDQPEDHPRHLHRRAWTDGGGPWLGVGQTRTLEVVTTCHLVVDGYAHGRIAAEIFRDLDANVANVKELTVAARAGLGDAAPASTAPPFDDAQPLGFAGRVIPGADLRFSRLAYALGRVLEATPGLPRRRGFSPTFQIPVAPGGRDDADRRRRRVVFGLVSLRRDGGELESFSSFRDRLPLLIEREAAEEGLLSRVLSATATAPLPAKIKRQLLTTRGLSHPWLPPIETLAGRAHVAFIRYPDGERPIAPLYAVSSPGLGASKRDRFGSFVVTVVHHGDQCTLSIGGTGRAGTAGGAHEVLDELLTELAAVPRV